MRDLLPRALIGAVLAALLGFAGPASGQVPGAWTTYHHDAGRSGVDPGSTSPVSTPTQLWQTSPALDGRIYGEPLVYGARVYVATENDSVYALDAATGAVIWQKSAGTAVPSVKFAPAGMDLLGPVVGITSTPVIDPTTNKIYVVARSWDGTQTSSIHHQLVGLDLATGATDTPRFVDPLEPHPLQLLQRAALTLDGNEIVIPFGGGPQDYGTYHGWLVAAREDAAGPLLSYEVSKPSPGVNSNSSGGPIWGSGNGPALDASGNIFAATGNGRSTNSYNYSESVLKLSPQLSLLDNWAPSNWDALDNGDIDIGSSQPLPLPGGLLFQIGKDGIGRLLHANSLGGVGGSEVTLTHACDPGPSGDEGAFGGGVYVPGKPAGTGTIYIACHFTLEAVSVDTTHATIAFKADWTTQNALINIGPPIFAGGLVWVQSWQNKTGTLYGVNPGNGSIRFSQNLGTTLVHFATPSAADGLLFAANNNNVTAFRIASAAATTTGLVSSQNASKPGASVTFTATVAPAPDAGTVSFSDGATLPGCGAVPVNASGQASCQATLSAAGLHVITATYSGDAGFSRSQSTLRQEVRPTVWVSKVKLKPSSFKARKGTVLSLVLAVPGKITVRIDHRVRGHRQNGSCSRTAVAGKRCTLTIKRATRRFNGTAGKNRFKLRVKSLQPGSYLATVTVVDQAGERSTAVVLHFTIKKPHH